MQVVTTIGTLQRTGRETRPPDNSTGEAFWSEGTYVLIADGASINCNGLVLDMYGSARKFICDGEASLQSIRSNQREVRKCRVLE